MRTRGFGGASTALLPIWVLVPQVCPDFESSRSACTFSVYMLCFSSETPKPKSKVNLASNGTNQHYVPEDNTGSFWRYFYENFITESVHEETPDRCN